MHSVTAVFDQNNDIGGIDSTWFAKIVPEHGANSVANSIYVGMDLVWVANDIRP
jgi:hypothetical protein